MPDTQNPALPDGATDPTSEWFVPEPARRYYAPPTSADWQRVGQINILPAKRPAEPGQSFAEHEAARQDRLNVSELPEFKAHHLALERAQAAADHAEAAAQGQARWDDQHACSICRSVVESATARDVSATPRHVHGPAIDSTLIVQACAPCSRALEAVIVERASADTVNGITRAELAATWLDRIE